MSHRERQRRHIGRIQKDEIRIVSRYSRTGCKILEGIIKPPVAHMTNFRRSRLKFPVPGLRFVPGRRAGLAQILRIQVSARSRSCGDHRSQQPARWINATLVEPKVAHDPAIRLFRGLDGVQRI
jgi:hypothetical protein